MNIHDLSSGFDPLPESGDENEEEEENEEEDVEMVEAE